MAFYSVRVVLKGGGGVGVALDGWFDTVSCECSTVQTFPHPQVNPPPTLQRGGMASRSGGSTMKDKRIQ